MNNYEVQMKTGKGAWIAWSGYRSIKQARHVAHLLRDGNPHLKFRIVRLKREVVKERRGK